MKKITFNHNATISLFFCCFWLLNYAQITSGKITYERKTNLLKRFKDPEMIRWLGDQNKQKTDMFELYFNDSISIFKPQEQSGEDPLNWATNHNTVYQNFSRNERLSILSVWGENLYVKDSTVQRIWKITDSKRKIGKYECRKAIWEFNDTTRIYAWFSDEIVPSIGPETFTGLPGAILGLANEDGGIIYFAKTVEILEPNMSELSPKIGKNKTASAKELRAKLEEKFGSRPEMNGFIIDLFMW